MKPAKAPKVSETSTCKPSERGWSGRYHSPCNALWAPRPFDADPRGLPCPNRCQPMEDEYGAAKGGAK